MVTISSDLLKIWKVAQKSLGCIITMPGDLDKQSVEEKVLPRATINNKGTLLVSYVGKLHLHLYEIKDHESYQKKDTINLRREIIANGVVDFNYTPGRDSVRSFRFLGGDNETHLRVYMVIDGEDFISDVQLSDGVSSLKKLARYQD